MRLDPSACRQWHAENLEHAAAAAAHPGWEVAATAAAPDGAPLQVERLRTQHPRGDFLRGSVLLGVDLATAAHRLLVDPDAHVDWGDTLDHCELHDELEVDGVTHRLLQIPVKTGAHPLVRDRELVYHEAIVRSEASVTTVAASRPAPSVPGLPGHRRAWLGLSHRQVTRCDAGQVCYRALWQTDLGGWLPRAAVTRGQVRAMLKEHQTFRGWWPPDAGLTGPAEPSR